jgi:hypothetical protein
LGSIHAYKIFITVVTSSYYLLNRAYCAILALVYSIILSSVQSSISSNALGKINAAILVFYDDCNYVNDEIFENETMNANLQTLL